MSAQISPLHQAHERLGARFMDFAGWSMPLHYGSAVNEHLSVRQAAGMFDISHMGVLQLEGRGAEELLNRLLTNDVRKLSNNEGQYTLMLNEGGGVIDDLLLYRLTNEKFLLVVNAAKLEEDKLWINRLCGDTAKERLTDLSPDYFGLAVQGPAALDLLEKSSWPMVVPERNSVQEQSGSFLCRTGYTGEDGFELFGPREQAEGCWREFLELKAAPCGLSARDTLRLEAGFPLNGADLTAEHSPIEAGLKPFVCFDKVRPFIGQARCELDRDEPSRLLMGLRATPGGAPFRAHYLVSDSEGTVVSELSSGGVSPSSRSALGLAYLPLRFAKPGKELFVQVRNRTVPVTVVRKNQLRP